MLTSDIEIAIRRKRANFMLTLPQLALLDQLQRSNNKVMSVKSGAPGFGMKTLAIACGDEFDRVVIYSGGYVMEAYIKLLKKLGMLTRDPTKSKVLVLRSSPYRLHRDSITANHRIILTDQAHEAHFWTSTGRNICLVYDAPIEASSRRSLTSMLSLRSILRIVRSNEDVDNNTIHILPKHSFDLKPEPTWNISTNTSVANIEDILVRYDKVLIITNTLHPTDIIAPEGYKKEPTIHSISSKRKKKQFCVVTKQKKFLSQAQHAEVDAIIIVSIEVFPYNDAIDVINHTDITRGKYDLYVLCDKTQLFVWEYLKIHTYRPWQKAANRNWYGSFDMLRVLTVLDICTTLTDPADKCVVCCANEYFVGSRVVKLYDWWQRNKGRGSLDCFEILLGCAQ